MIATLLLLLALLVLCAVLVRGKPEAGHGKLAFLDGIRGVAALVVVFYHFLSFFYPATSFANPDMAHHAFGWESWLALSPFYFAYSGLFSVAIFFVLSGFVLSYSYMAKGDAEIVISSAFRRYSRLALPVLVTSLFYLLFLQTGWFDKSLYPTLETITHSPYFHNRFNFDPSLLDLLKDSLFVIYVKFNHYRYNNVLWTMAIEFIGSMVLFFSLFVFKQSPWRYLGYVLTFVLAAGIFKEPFLIAFPMGMLLCALYQGGAFNALAHKISNPRLPTLIPPLIPVAPLLLPLYLCPNHLCLPPFPDAFNSLPPTLHTPRLQTLFATPFARYLGKISFALYLSHYLVLLSFSSAIFKWLHDQLTYDAAVLITVATSLPLMFGLAWLVYWYVDRAAIEMGRVLYRPLRAWWFSVKSFKQAILD